MAFVYPRNRLDDAGYLLSLIGSFWHNVYEGQDEVQEVLFARGQLDVQTYLNFLELIRACSHYHIPVYHTDNWYFLQFKESESGANRLTTYEVTTPEVYNPNQELAYGVPQPNSYYRVTCPTDLKDVKVILNRLSAPSLTWVAGVDFVLESPGVLAFLENPFANELVSMRDYYDEHGAIADREAGLWLFRGQFDWDQIYQQFGYALALRLKSSPGYQRLVSAILEAYTLGVTATSFQKVLSAITDVPLTAAEETVEFVGTDNNHLIVVTDREAYKFTPDSTPLVAAGDVVPPGSPLVDTLQFYEFGDGQVSPDLTSLTVGAGLLANGYRGSLQFVNEDVPLVVETVNGLTKVSFEIHGFPEDVTQFWDEVHARGIARGQTLAQLLDVRANPQDEPTAASLPATINPLEFLCQNLLRYHVFVVKIKASHQGPEALGLNLIPQLKRIVPPEKALIVLTEFEPADTLEPDNVAEALTSFTCGAIVDALDYATVVNSVRAYPIYGKCE